MTPEEIRKKRAALEKRREKYFIDKYKLEDACPHENATKKHKGNTGNYDPASDLYWTEFTCPDCGKFWTEP